MSKSLPNPTSFSGTLNPDIQAKVDQCNALISDPERLRALFETGLINSIKEAALDRLAKLAAKALDAPLTIVSLVTDEKQIFKGGYGLPPGMEESREIPIDGSLCRYTLQGEPIIASDAASDPLLKFHPATGPWGIGAFIAIPMITQSGHVLGAFCAVHPEPHQWTEDEILIMQELTNSVMTEIHLRQQVSELEEEKELRERFVLTLTHDLRTPLASAKLSAQMISSGKADLPQLQKAAVRIAANIDRGDRLIQNILDVNKIKSGQELPVKPVDFDMSKLARLIITDFEAQYGERFDLEVPDAHIVRMDLDGITRMVENLLQNAVKYGGRKTRIKLTVEVADQETMIEIHNFGNPILEEDFKAIFEPFKRTENATKSGQKGWGLGLTLVRSLAKAHNGFLDVESSPELGTTFTISVPTTR
jgi:signal transduction histidine kinase